MKYDNYGSPIFQSNDLFDLIYKGKFKFDGIKAENTEEIKKFISNSMLNIDTNANQSFDIEEYDKIKQSEWMIPPEYNDFDIYVFCLENCQSDSQKIRCMEELMLFEKLNMIPVLTVLKYIVDTLRECNIVWGVGRGSSVASYVLYILGVHKIDSLKYNLDYTEFLRTGEN